MQKTKTRSGSFLLVMSWIYLVLALGMIGLALYNLTRPDIRLNFAGVTDAVFLIIGGVLGFVAGIFGLVSKQLKRCRILGLVLLVGRMARSRLVRWPSIVVIEFLRGTPTLLLIYVCFLLLPLAGIKLSTYWMLTLPIGLSTAAVVAEVYRAGVLAVPRGQTDAGRSLGLTEAQVFFVVVFPQALRYIVPALVAQLVIVVKDTTFGYVVTYGELMQSARVLIANYQSLVPVYLVVALLYCLVNYAISRASQRLGRPMY